MNSRSFDWAAEVMLVSNPDMPHHDSCKLGKIQAQMQDQDDKIAKTTNWQESSDRRVEVKRGYFA